jgi:hypothetical protein
VEIGITHCVSKPVAAYSALFATIEKCLSEVKLEGQ